MGVIDVVCYNSTVVSQLCKLIGFEVSMLKISKLDNTGVVVSYLWDWQMTQMTAFVNAALSKHGNVDTCSSTYAPQALYLH